MGDLQREIDKFLKLAYNILIKTASKGSQGSPSWQDICLRRSRLFFDMYPEFWTHIYKLGGHHGCFSVFYRRHPFCFCLDSFAIIVINIFINSNCKFFK